MDKTVHEFVEKHSHLLKSEGFTETMDVKNKIRFKKEGVAIDLEALKDTQMIKVTTRLPSRLKYTSIISYDDESGIFEKLIRSFHDQDSYRKT